MKRVYRTKQRESILRYLRNCENPVTATEIHSYLHEQGKSVGLATVYRTVERLVTDGTAIKVVLRDGSTWGYIETAGTPDGFYIRCDSCGQLSALDCEQLGEIKHHIFENHGFLMNPGKSIFYGICEHCRE